MPLTDVKIARTVTYTAHVKVNINDKGEVDLQQAADVCRRLNSDVDSVPGLDWKFVGANHDIAVEPNEGP
jgi:hypothetical protein